MAVVMDMAYTPNWESPLVILSLLLTDARREPKMIRIMTSMLVLCLFSGLAWAGAEAPAMLVHMERHTGWKCHEDHPAIGKRGFVTTHSGVGEVDAYIVLTRFDELKGISFGLRWPEAWGEADWKDCGDLRIGDIQLPGDVTSIVWKDCRKGPGPLIIGRLTVTVTSPGQIKIIPSPKEGAVAIGDCNELATSLKEVMFIIDGGAGGMPGEDRSMVDTIVNRNWQVRPDSTGDAPTIGDALREAMPGDTVFVAGGWHRGPVVLRQGVVISGSWDEGFLTRDLGATPSVIDGEGLGTAVRSSFGEDSTTVLDGFVITGASGKVGAGVFVGKGASPTLRNLIIHSNRATYGAGILCREASPTIENVLIVNNSANTGSAIYCATGSSPRILNATLAANQTSSSGTIFLSHGSVPYIERCIICHTGSGSAIYAQDASSRAALACCAVWAGREDGVVSAPDDTVSLKANTFSNVEFVDPSNFDFRTKAPVTAGDDCGRIGSSHKRVPSAGLRR
jgi:hypothetical protein